MVGGIAYLGEFAVNCASQRVTGCMWLSADRRLRVVPRHVPARLWVAQSKMLGYVLLLSLVFLAFRLYENNKNIILNSHKICET